MIGALFILLGAFLMGPWDVYDVVDFAQASYQKLAQKHEANKQKRFVKKEEKAAKKAEEKRLKEEQAAQEAEKHKEKWKKQKKKNWQ